MKSSTILVRCSLVGFSLTTAFMLAAGCGSAKQGSGFDDGDNTNSDAGISGEGGSKGPGLGGGDSDGGVDCNAGNYGSISGTAYAPNGTLPLYNVIVFAPTTALDPLTEGVSCDKCGSVSGNPAASTTSGPDGKFSLNGVPAGDNVPVVLQVGKWRRQITIPYITKCTDTPITDPNQSRLPKNHTEGDLPHIAVTTGGCDAIACVLPKMGIDSTEFGVQSDYANKRVIFYQGGLGPTINSGSPAITAAQNLWGSATELAKYDVAIFSCECTESPSSKAPADETVVANYLDSGGRTFGTDFMYTWTHQGTQFTGVPPTPTDNIMESFVGDAPGDTPGTYSIDTTFPKGVALGQWLQAVGGSTTATDVALTSVFKNFGRADPTLAQRWVYGDTDKAISYTTPFSSAEADRCGKSYFMDIHVGSGSVDSTFPADCGTTLTPQEKMMVFFLMDLASCIQDDTKPVSPPR